jgi:hypothetical protein
MLFSSPSMGWLVHRATARNLLAMARFPPWAKRLLLFDAGTLLQSLLIVAVSPQVTDGLLTAPVVVCTQTS